VCLQVVLWPDRLRGSPFVPRSGFARSRRSVSSSQSSSCFKAALEVAVFDPLGHSPPNSHLRRRLRRTLPIRNSILPRLPIWLV
jgi:hypothetical protein